MIKRHKPQQNATVKSHFPRDGWKWCCKVVRNTAPSRFRDRVSLSSQPTAIFARRKGRKDHSLGKDAPDENTSHSVYVGEFCVPPLAPTTTASARDTA